MEVKFSVPDDVYAIAATFLEQTKDIRRDMRMAIAMGNGMFRDFYIDYCKKFKEYMNGVQDIRRDQIKKTIEILILKDRWLWREE